MMRKYKIEGMSCAACQARVEKAVSQVSGVTSCSVSLLTNMMGVEGEAPDSDIIKAVVDAGYGAKVISSNDSGSANKNQDNSFEDEILKDTETPKLKKRLITSIIFLMVLMYISMGHNMLNFPLPNYFNHNHLALTITQMLLAIIVMVINRQFFINGFRSILNKSPNMDALVALGSSASFIWSLIIVYKMCGMITNGASNMELMDLYHNELYFEAAAMIPTLITIGKMLESMSKGKTTSALKSLIKLTPKTAVIIKDGKENVVSIDEVNVGDIFIVKPGDNIPVDGEVVDGESAVNESALTGESIPVDKVVGDKVSAATTNQNGVLKCRAVRVGEDTTLSQIIRLVSDAASTKAPIARIADKVSGVFVPVVILIAIIVVITWIFLGQSASFALARGISVLVISCPCALGLATPVAIMVGNGVGAKNGILFKTSEALEVAGKTSIVALDKTGTITKGEPQVTDIYNVEAKDEDELLSLAYAVEKNSEHPLAKAIVNYVEENNTNNYSNVKVSDFKALPGNGLTANVNGHTVNAGSFKYISTLINIDSNINDKINEFANAGKTSLLFASDKKFLGVIAVADTIKDDSKDAIDDLKNLNIKSVMLTGDTKKTALAISSFVGVDDVIAEVMPNEKGDVITKFQKDGKVAMVGDGINDALALTKADVGIAIGAGTDVAIESADIVIMNNSLVDVVNAIRLSKATIKNIYENLFWAFFYNIICIPLAAGVFPYKMNPMLAAAAMSLSSFTVCMNALRLNLFKVKKVNTNVPNKNIKLENKERKNIMTKVVKIEGMMCPHCEARVKEAFLKCDKVSAAVVSHEKGTAELQLNNDISVDEIKKIVEDAGYKYIGLE